MGEVPDFADIAYIYVNEFEYLSKGLNINLTVKNDNPLEAGCIFEE